MNQGNMEEIPFNQINSALLWLLQHKIINDEQYRKLQGYYKKTNFYNVDELRNELFKLGTDPVFLTNKIAEIENLNNTSNQFNNQGYDNLNSGYQDMNNFSMNTYNQNDVFISQYNNNHDVYDSEGETLGKQKRFGTIGGISWSDESEKNTASQNDSRAAFTNILFFIFLAGLSVGVVFMVILNFFIK